MFSVFGIGGRMPALPDGGVSAVRGAARTRAVGGSAQDREAGGGAAGGGARGALAAYAQTAQDERRPLTQVHDVMSPGVHVLAHDATLAHAWRFLAQHAIGQVPVVGADGTLVGLLVRADLLPLDDADPARWSARLAQPVSAAMRTPVPAAHAGADLRRVAALLLDTGLPGLPVVDDAGAVTGFVSRSDILRAVVADPPLDVWS